jgi:hypothetical protein
MTTGTTSRTAHLLALMKKGGDVHPGLPGHSRGSVTRKAPGGPYRGCCRAPWPSARITQHA